MVSPVQEMCDWTCRRWSTSASSCNPNFHATGAHYLNCGYLGVHADPPSDLFKGFPTLRLVIPHGGGAVPYHWGRYRGRPEIYARRSKYVRDNMFFDTCVYHLAGLELWPR